MLRLNNVKQIFGTTALNYPDWEVMTGEHALILGNSGSGKTTLLHIVSGLLRNTQGKVEMNNRLISEMSQSKLDRFRGENVGLVFQKPHLIKALTVAENIRLAGKFGGKKVKNSRLDDILEALDIRNLKDRKVHELSEGQAQRVSIARAVIHEPSLLAADEPTASLDDENCERVISLLKSQAERCKATLIIATHDQRVKDQFSNRLEL